VLHLKVTIFVYFNIPPSIARLVHSNHDVDVRIAAQLMMTTIENLHAMMEYEIAHSYCRDYLSDDACNMDDRANFNTHHIKLTAEDRAQIVGWCYGVVDVLQLSRVNVAVAMSLADRFMSIQPNRQQPFSSSTSSTSSSSGGGVIPRIFRPQEIMYDRTMFQLLAVSALYIAIKINKKAIYSSEMFAEATHGMYTREEIEAMERAILECLSWRITTPTALEIGYTILELITHQVRVVSGVNNVRWPEVSIREDVASQIEEVVRDYQLAIQRTSIIATAALSNAIEMQDTISNIEKEHYLNALSNVLEQCKQETLRSEKKHLLNAMLSVLEDCERCV